MVKSRAAQANSGRGIHVARDAAPAPAPVQKIVDRLAIKTRRETAAIKAKRPAS